jgi:hypothetical protein
MTSNEPHGIGALNVIPGIDGGEFRPPRIDWPASRAGSAGTSGEILTVPAAEDLRAPSGLPSERTRGPGPQEYERGYLRRSAQS